MNIRVGIDIGGTKIHGVALNPEEPLEIVRDEIRDTRRGATQIVESVREVYEKLVAGLPVGSNVLSAGLGVPGVVNAGHVAHAVNLDLAHESLALGAKFATLTGPVPVVVENDVKAAALGAAQWLRKENGSSDDMALLNVGTGLAAALILDGRLRNGARGVAGEIGHLVIDPHGPPCRCGKRGCLELYASGGGLRRNWPGTAQELFDAAVAGDPRAITLRDRLVAGIAHAVRALVHICDVECVVLTGGVVSETPSLRRELVALLEHDRQVSSFDRMVAVADRLRWLPPGLPAGAIGAALLGERTSASWT